MAMDEPQYRQCDDRAHEPAAAAWHGAKETKPWYRRCMPRNETHGATDPMVERAATTRRATAGMPTRTRGIPRRPFACEMRKHASAMRPRVQSAATFGSPNGS